MTSEELLEAIFGEQPKRDPAADQVLFTLCRHCNRAISLNPAKFYTDEAGNLRKPDWDLERYWCHFQLVEDKHLPEPKRPFIDHLWPIPN